MRPSITLPNSANTLNWRYTSKMIASNRLLLWCLFSLGIFALGSTCNAHFLWLKTISQNDRQQVFLFFGENVVDEAYRMPERIAATKVWLRAADGKRAELDTKGLESEDRIGLIAPLDNNKPFVLEANQPYGIYGKSMLVYYAKHVYGGDAAEFNASGESKELKLDIVPQAKGDELELTVLWQGKPLKGVDLVVSMGDAEPIEKTTDDDGRATLKLDGKGMVGVLANHMDKEESGKHDGNPYEGVLHYASLTFDWPQASASEKKSAEDSKSAASQSALPLLPEPLSSFGAAVEGGWLYVYGGHTGEEHKHSAANLSNYFRRIKIDGGKEWEDLPTETPLQGLALVSHAEKVYRIGGLNARNATTKDDEDLHSTADFAQFDPATGQWKKLAPLPTPRSSHNAAVIGDRLYVIGGWQLKGKSPSDWQQDLLMYDFTAPDTGWQAVSEALFKRRALAASHWNGQLAAIGGIDEKGDVSQRVDLFDPQSGQWSKGPELPGAGLAGFGGSACNLDGTLYVSGLRGILYRLNDSGSAWEEAARQSKGRFFHQLLPAGNDGGLIAIGGASRKGHMADSEWIDPRGSDATQTR